MLEVKPTSIMANKTIFMSRIRQILRLYTQGASKKKISELTTASRNTVKKIHPEVSPGAAHIFSDQ